MGFFSRQKVPHLTDWDIFVPTGTWTTNTTYKGQWRRVGPDLEMYIQIDLAGAPTSTVLYVDLPFDLQASAKHMTVLNSYQVGIARYVDSGATSHAYGHCVISPTDNTQVQPRLLNWSASANKTMSTAQATTPITWASGDIIYMNVTIPISGWKANK
jgi:hypothetical protein